MTDQNSDQEGGWRRLKRFSFSSKDLSRHMRKVEGVTLRHARKFVFKRLSNIREVRRHIATWVIIIGVIIGATGLQILWFQQSYRAVVPSNGGTYAEASLGPVNSLDPLFASSSAEQTASQLLFSRLVDYDTTGHLNYDLATNIKLDDKKTTYTVTIRPDAKWSDGMQLTTQDIAFTIGLIKNASVHSTISGWSNVTVTVINDTTISFTLPGVYAAFENALSFPVLPEHILKDVTPSALGQSSFSTSPVGSGPFTFRFIQDVDAASGREIIHLARNDTYYGGAPKLERFQIHVYGSSDDIVKALSSGEVNAATDLSVTDLSRVKPSQYASIRKPIDSGVYAIFNTTSPILKDKAIRQALQIGTNTNAIRSALGADTPSLYLPFINGQVNGNVPAAPVYDQQQAAQMLDADGWKLNGSTRSKDGVDLRLSVVTTKNSDLEKALTVLTSQWRALGITLTTTVVDPGTTSQNMLQSVLQQRNYDVLVYQLTIGSDPDVYAYWHSSQATASGFNFSNYASAISDDALLSARTRTEPDLRTAKYLTFAKQWLADVPAIGLYQSTMQYVYSKDVHTNLTSDILVSPVDRFNDVLNWSVGQRVVQKTP